jgi:hypothetical protein
MEAKPYLLPARAALGGGNTGIDHTEGALRTGAKETKRALGIARDRVKRFLQRN